MRLKEKDIIEIYKTYLIWKEEGSKPYFAHSIKKDTQSFYDEYKESIIKLRDNIYKFNVEVDGGIESDEWEQGTFEIKEGRIKILEHRSYLN